MDELNLFNIERHTEYPISKKKNIIVSIDRLVCWHSALRPNATIYVIFGYINSAGYPMYKGFWKKSSRVNFK